MRRVVPGLFLLLLAASVAAQPELHLAKAPGGDLLASWEPESGAGEPLAWNLYLGDLVLVGYGQHRGSPQGRCSLPAESREVLLEGQGATRGGAYYLLSSFDDSPEEQDVGFESEGEPRRHDFPCRYQTSCPGGGAAINPAANWVLLHGTLPGAQLAPPVFTATNMDGTVRTEADLIGHPTVMWFYPAAATGG